MKNRSPAAVFFLSLITIGIYDIVWHVKTKGELNRLGANIPTAWLLIVPLANLYWVWRYAQGVELVTKGQISAVLTLILLLLLSIVGIAILQSEYNKLGVAATSSGPAPGPLGDGLSANAPAPVTPQVFGAAPQNSPLPGPAPSPPSPNPTFNPGGTPESPPTPPPAQPPVPPSLIQ